LCGLLFWKIAEMASLLSDFSRHSLTASSAVSKLRIFDQGIIILSVHIRGVLLLFYLVLKHPRPAGLEAVFPRQQFRKAKSSKVARSIPGISEYKISFYSHKMEENQFIFIRLNLPQIPIL
jgi:hypothetical protein